ncbi:MAG: response regulator transcription factor [Anaerolineae bacterium]|nr:response regulator transcription factor [Anaerolineae bacterium]
MPLNILLIEGHSLGQRSWAPTLLDKGYAVSVAHTRRDSQARLGSASPSLIIVDSRALRFDALRFCNGLRSDGNDVPLLLIVPEGAEVVQDASVDVCIREPFTSRKLLNRVKRLLPAQSDKVLEVGGVALDLEQRVVNGPTINQRLTPKQARLLEIFMRHPGQVLTRSFLMKQIWETDFVEDTRTLEVHIHWLRRAIEANPARPVYLTTVRGVGYRFDVPQVQTGVGEGA